MNKSRLKPTKTILIGTSLRDRPVERHFVALGRELMASGYQVVLLVHGPVDRSIELDPRVNVLIWPSPRPTQVVDMLFFDRLVRQLRPCCLISNFGSRNIMLTIGGVRGVPTRIHWYHTVSSAIENDWCDSHLKLGFLKLRARITLSFATHVIANSNAAREDVIKTFGVPSQKCQVFWNALEDFWSQPSGGAPPPAASSSSSGHFVCVGRFAPSKGQDILLNAIARLLPRHPKTTVEFIGDGSTRAACEEVARKFQLGECCRFSGSLPHSEVLSRMAMATAVVVPSWNEAFGLVNIESMSVGVPVIGSNTGGIAEIVRDGIDGLLFPPGDHDALARHMMTLLENEPLRAQMAANARRRFLEHFESTQAVKMQARWIIGQVRNAADGCPQPGVGASVPEQL